MHKQGDCPEQGEIKRHLMPRRLLSAVIVASGLSVLCNSCRAADPLIRQQKTVIEPGRRGRD
jgi:hypothetical protein